MNYGSGSNTIHPVSGFFLMRLALALVFLLAVIMPGNASADTLVQCRYLKAEGTNIELRLDIASPPPVSVILAQNLPPGVTITDARPQFNKFNKKQGVVKWLLKDVAPGSLVVHMRLSRPIQADEIRGEIRYMDPAVGKMIKIKVRP